MSCSSKRKRRESQGSRTFCELLLGEEFEVSRLFSMQLIMVIDGDVFHRAFADCYVFVAGVHPLLRLLGRTIELEVRLEPLSPVLPVSGQ
jgi:hypothetical protein